MQPDPCMPHIFCLNGISFMGEPPRKKNIMLANIKLQGFLLNNVMCDILLWNGYSQLTVIFIMKIRSVMSGLLSISSLSTVTAVQSPSR